MQICQFCTASIYATSYTCLPYSSISWRHKEQICSLATRILFFSLYYEKSKLLDKLTLVSDKGPPQLLYYWMSLSDVLSTEYKVDRIWGDQIIKFEVAMICFVSALLYDHLDRDGLCYLLWELFASENIPFHSSYCLSFSFPFCF